MKDLLNLDYISHFFTNHRMHSMREDIIEACKIKLDKPHGDVTRWQTALKEMPEIKSPQWHVSDDFVHLTGECDWNNEVLEKTLKAFCPWRKGPFDFLGTHIDTEWNSLLKWRRVQDALRSANIDLTGDNVLDIGCGNGAFLWGLLSDGAQSVTGVDPMWLFYHQFMVFQRYIRSPQLCFLPLGIQDLPLKNSFDSILSMGVLYHRRSPLDHLAQLKGLLKNGGTLIMETIVLPDEGKTLLTPPDRYAGMRNVWMIPSVSVLQDWLNKMGFTILHTSRKIKTTLDEQHQSNWMDFHSLNQFLDKTNDTLTIEGHPAPYRSIIIAEA